MLPQEFDRTLELCDERKRKLCIAFLSVVPCATDQLKLGVRAECDFHFSV